MLLSSLLFLLLLWFDSLMYLDMGIHFPLPSYSFDKSKGELVPKVFIPSQGLGFIQED